MNIFRKRFYAVSLLLLVVSLTGCAGYSGLPTAAQTDVASKVSPSPTVNVTVTPTPTSSPLIPEPTSPVTTPTPTASPKPAVLKSADVVKCREKPLAGVKTPANYDILEKCKTVSGIVQKVTTTKNNNYVIDLTLNADIKDQNKDKTAKSSNQSLRVEVAPFDTLKIAKVKKGEHITVTGAYVFDKLTKQNEMYPAWIINGKGSVQYDAKEPVHQKQATATK